MKHIKKDKPRQARRQRALERFKLKAARGGDEAYLARKEEELAALNRALGFAA